MHFDSSLPRGDWEERSAASRQLASPGFEEHRSVPLHLLDDPNTAVIEAAAQMLLDREDAFGVAVFARGTRTPTPTWATI
jgi:hypothetical protein